MTDQKKPPEPLFKNDPPTEELEGTGAVLSASDIEAVREKARKAVHKELKDAEEKRLLASFMQEERAKAFSEDEIEQVYFDLPRFAMDVRVDGRVYQNGVVREFPRRVANTMRDIISNAWKHDNAAFGREDPYHYMKQRAMGPRGSGAIATAGGAYINTSGSLLRV